MFQIKSESKNKSKLKLKLSYWKNLDIHIKLNKVVIS